MRSVNDAIEDRVSEGWIPDDLVPAAYGNLTGDQQRPSSFTVVNDLQQIAPLFGVQRLRPPVVDDQQAGARQAPHQACQPPFAACGGEVGEQARSPAVGDGESVTARLMAQR